MHNNTIFYQLFKFIHVIVSTKLSALPLEPLLQAFHHLAAVPRLHVRTEHMQSPPAGNLQRSADQPVTALSSGHEAGRQIHTLRCDEPSRPVSVRRAVQRAAGQIREARPQARLPLQKTLFAIDSTTIAV